MQTRLLTLATAMLVLGSCDISDYWPPPGGSGSGGGSSGPTPPEPALLIDHEPLTGFTVHDAAARQNDPRAGEPTYVYLQAGLDAVQLPGAPVPDPGPGSLFVLQDPSVVEDDNGFTVKVNGRLSYRVAIDDFEKEISLARVELRKQGSVIFSRFIFPGRAALFGGGVAHGLTITATVDGVPVGISAPTTIEVR